MRGTPRILTRRMTRASRARERTSQPPRPHSRRQCPHDTAPHITSGRNGRFPVPCRRHSPLSPAGRAAMYPPAMEAATGGVLVKSGPGRCRLARARTLGHGMAVVCSSTQFAARRRLLVASLGVRESLPAQSLGEEAVPVEMDEEESDDSAEIPPSPDVPTAKTVRVKFVLEKMCAFGEQFLVVGDDPALGLWDPANAAALEWSEGHLWTVNTNLPANKLIEFKFLLRDASGRVRWQHGANRTLQTTDTPSPNTLVVHEDWDHGGNQKVTEEEELSIAAIDMAFSDYLAGSAGAIMLPDELRPRENLESEYKSAVADTPASLNGVGAMEANEENQQQFILEKDQAILDELHGEADTAPQNGYYSSSPDDDNARPNEDDTAMCQGDAQIPNGTSIFENDLVWARRALRQLLRFLGFQIGTTRT